jgi:16S rRNA (guanine966-N2)-methyltransferase
LANPRIIAGKAKGMRLRGVPGDTTRPITDRVKEALFNILGPDIIDAKMLDLFAGTGSVGIEALSRGASYVHLNEINRQVVNVIRENLIHTRLDLKAYLTQSDAFVLLKKPPNIKFDYVFIAPPQYKQLWLSALELIDQNPDWLQESAWVIVQIDPVEYQPMTLINLTEFDQRRYGSTLLVFFEYRPPTPSSTNTTDNLSASS